MPLAYREHFLLRTEGIQTTKDWYVKVPGGPRKPQLSAQDLVTAPN